jgi:hypothetical protein
MWNRFEKQTLNYADPATEVRAALRLPERSWYANLGTTAITMLLFIGTGALHDPLDGAIILVATLLVHEFGHGATMKLLKYSNVQVLFIPSLAQAFLVTLLTPWVPKNPS